MKQQLLFAFLFITVACFGQNSQYVEMMKQGISKIQYMTPTDELQQAVNQMERVANVEKSEWLPSYYAALGSIYLASKEMQSGGGKLKDYVAKAAELLEKVKAIAPDNSEVLTLEGYVNLAHIWENPMVNGAKYSPLAFASFQKAVEADPNNPRPDYLWGQNLFYTPAAFGGGKEAAKVYFDKAKKKFETFKASSEIMPNWGKPANDYFLEQCAK